MASNAGTHIELERLLVRIIGDASKYHEMLGDVERTTAKTAEKIQNLGKEMFKYITIPLAGIGYMALKEFREFDLAMTEAIAKMGKQTREVREEMEEFAKAFSVSGEVRFSATKLARGYEELGAQGLSASQAMAALPVVAKFAQAGAFDLDKATRLLLSSLNSFGMMTLNEDKLKNRLERFSDVIVGIANRTSASVEEAAKSIYTDAAAQARLYGASIEELGAVIAIYALTGKTAEEAGNTAGRLMRLLQTSFANNRRDWERYNITIVDSQENFLDFASAIENITVGMANLSPVLQARAKSEMGIQALAQKSLNMLLGRQELLRSLTKKLKEEGGTAEMAAIQMMSFAAALDVLYNHFINFKITFGKQLSVLALVAVNVLAVFSKAWNNIPKVIQEAIVHVLVFAAALGPILLVAGALVKIFSRLLVIPFITGIGGIVSGLFNYLRFFNNFINMLVAAPIYLLLNPNMKGLYNVYDAFANLFKGVSSFKGVLISLLPILGKMVVWGTLIGIIFDGFDVDAAKGALITYFLAMITPMRAVAAILISITSLITKIPFISVLTLASRLFIYLTTVVGSVLNSIINSSIALRLYGVLYIGLEKFIGYVVVAFKKLVFTLIILKEIIDILIYSLLYLAPAFQNLTTLSSLFGRLRGLTNILGSGFLSVIYLMSEGVLIAWVAIQEGVLIVTTYVRKLILNYRTIVVVTNIIITLTAGLGATILFLSSEVTVVSALFRSLLIQLTIGLSLVNFLFLDILSSIWRVASGVPIALLTNRIYNLIKILSIVATSATVFGVLTFAVYGSVGSMLLLLTSIGTLIAAFGIITLRFSNFTKYSLYFGKVITGVSAAIMILKSAWTGVTTATGITKLIGIFYALGTASLFFSSSIAGIIAILVPLGLLLHSELISTATSGIATLIKAGRTGLFSPVLVAATRFAVAYERIFLGLKTKLINFGIIIEGIILSISTAFNKYIYAGRGIFLINSILITSAIRLANAWQSLITLVGYLSGQYWVLRVAISTAVVNTLTRWGLAIYRVLPSVYLLVRGIRETINQLYLFIMIGGTFMRVFQSLIVIVGGFYLSLTTLHTYLTDKLAAGILVLILLLPVLNNALNSIGLLTASGGVTRILREVFSISNTLTHRLGILAGLSRPLAYLISIIMTLYRAFFAIINLLPSFLAILVKVFLLLNLANIAKILGDALRDLFSTMTSNLLITITVIGVAITLMYRFGISIRYLLDRVMDYIYFSGVLLHNFNTLNRVQKVLISSLLVLSTIFLLLGSTTAAALTGLTAIVTISVLLSRYSGFAGANTYYLAIVKLINAFAWFGESIIVFVKARAVIWKWLVVQIQAMSVTEKFVRILIILGSTVSLFTGNMFGLVGVFAAIIGPISRAIYIFTRLGSVLANIPLFTGSTTLISTLLGQWLRFFNILGVGIRLLKISFSSFLGLNSVIRPLRIMYIVVLGLVAVVSSFYSVVIPLVTALAMLVPILYRMARIISLINLGTLGTTFPVLANIANMILRIGPALATISRVFSAFRLSLIAFFTTPLTGGVFSQLFLIASLAYEVIRLTWALSGAKQEYAKLNAEIERHKILTEKLLEKQDVEIDSVMRRSQAIRDPGAKETFLRENLDKYTKIQMQMEKRYQTELEAISKRSEETRPSFSFWHLLPDPYDNPADWLIDEGFSGAGKRIADSKLIQSIFGSMFGDKVEDSLNREADVIKQKYDKIKSLTINLNKELKNLVDLELPTHIAAAESYNILTKEIGSFIEKITVETNNIGKSEDAIAHAAFSHRAMALAQKYNGGVIDETTQKLLEQSKAAVALKESNKMQVEFTEALRELYLEGIHLQDRFDWKKTRDLLMKGMTGPQLKVWEKAQLHLEGLKVTEDIMSEDKFYVFQKRMKQLNELFNAKEITYDIYTKGVDSAKNSLMEATDQANDFRDALKGIDGVITGSSEHLVRYAAYLSGTTDTFNRSRMTRAFTTQDIDRMILPNHRPRVVEPLANLGDMIPEHLFNLFQLPADLARGTPNFGLRALDTNLRGLPGAFGEAYRGLPREFNRRARDPLAEIFMNVPGLQFGPHFAPDDPRFVPLAGQQAMVPLPQNNQIAADTRVNTGEAVVVLNQIRDILQNKNNEQVVTLIQANLGTV